MALEGNAKDFGLSEIFQLISIQKKSGMLSITAKSKIAIFFQNGMIISTRDRRNRSKDPLKDFLLRYGFIDRDRMNSLQQIQSESNMDLTEILVSEKYFSEDELRQIFTEQIYESVQEVLTWPKSHYKFIAGTNVLTGVKSYASINVEGILMESMRRIDELPQMKKIFSSDKMIFTKLPFPMTSGFSIGKNEEVIYELLENERTLEYLITNSRMARFNTYESLKELLEKELLEIKEDSKAVKEKFTEDIPKTEERKKIRALPVFATVILLIASFIIGEYLVPMLNPPGWAASRKGPVTKTDLFPETLISADIDNLRLRQLKSSLAEALEEYNAISGSYPFTLEILTARRILPGKIIEKSQQAGLIYRTSESGKSYSLRRK